jgi:hypothetical protein
MTLRTLFGVGIAKGKKKVGKGKTLVEMHEGLKWIEDKCTYTTEPFIHTNEHRH